MDSVIFKFKGLKGMKDLKVFKDINMLPVADLRL
jgi:hypothetical protein